MPTRSACRALAAVAALALALWLGPSVTQAQSVSIGTNPPGSVFYAVGSGLAKVVSDAGKVKMAVQPHSGSSTFLPLLNSVEWTATARALPDAVPSARHEP